jgi:hypothetical protein
MTKREMIDEILAINASAEPQFLARFADDQIFQYLTHLRVLSTPRLTGNADRYEKYFRNLPKTPGIRPQWRADTRHVEETSVDEKADLACQAQPANDAQPTAPAVEHAQVSAAPADALAVGPDGWAADTATEPRPAAADEAAPQPAPADQADQANQDAQAVPAQDASRQELVAQDVDLAVGQAEREQLLSTPPELADDQADDDEANMEAPFKIATSPRRTAATRSKASNAARHMLYGADTPQPPPRPRRRAKSCAQAAVAVAPQPDPGDLDDLDDEKWPY